MRPTEIKLVKKPNILVVEDDRDQRKLMVHLIRESLSCEIVEATDGLAALTMMLQEKLMPDLILLDLLLPYLGGVEFLSIIRGRSEFDHVPVIVSTAVAESTGIRGELGNRIQGFLAKPINGDRLLEKLVGALHPILFRVDYHN